MAKSVIFLPKDPTATRSMLVFKLFLILLFFLSLISQAVYTYFTVRYFKEKITLESTRSQVQIFRTHGHFFLLSGLWSIVVLTIGCWGILSELIGIIIGYVFMCSAGIVFQVMGSFASDDVNVAKLKMLGAIVDPVLIFLSLIYAHLVRQYTNTLFSLPVYRKNIIESRRSSFSDALGSPDGCNDLSSGSVVNHSDHISKQRRTSTQLLDVNRNHLHVSSPNFYDHTQVIPSFLNENIFFARNPAFDNYK